jgi:hypothetical protein
MHGTPTSPQEPPSAALVDRWRVLCLQLERGDGLGGTLGERTERMALKRMERRAIEFLLCERSWNEPAVER